jgi:LuxR family maltose regulon positive regulatory protein
VAWLSLDERDNNATLFWSYVIVALQTLYDDLGTPVLNMLQTPRGLPNEALLGQLLNQIGEISEPFALILDDVHVITNPQIHETLIFFLENLPAQMHLVVSSRADPPWPLARWRARDQVVEIRTDNLRFTPAETAAFLNEAMGLDLSPEDVTALGARTEGWIAGLQLAALALQGIASTQERDPGSFVRAFSGSHRYILDYLVEEVLDRQTPDIQEFLLQTCILERLTAPLCDAVRFGLAEAPSRSRRTAVRFGPAEAPSRSRGTAVRFGTPKPPADSNGENSQAILERLEQANLFLVPLDDERRWYRYHRLFADLLRSRLEQEYREHVTTLHRRAGAWCEEQGLLSEAVGHALAANDVDAVTRMARQNALATMDHGQLATLVGLIDALPDKVLDSRPWLCIAHAWALVFAGQLDAVGLRLVSTEAALDALGDAGRAAGPALSTAEERHIAGHIAAIRGYVSALRGDMTSAAELTRKALGQLPQEDLAVRGLSEGLLGSALRWNGELVAAAQSLDRALAITRASGDSSAAVETLCSLAAVQLAQGQLHKTTATCQEALLLGDEHARRSGRRLPVAASGHNIMSQVLCEWNDLDGAIHRASEGIALSEQWGWPEGLALGYRRRARALQAMGDSEGAQQAIQKARQAASDLSPWFGAHMAAHEARLWLAQGNLAPAFRWAQENGLSEDDEPSYQQMDEYSAVARVLIAQGKLDKASKLLVHLLEMAETAGAMAYMIETLILQALVLQAQSKDEQALTALERALTIAEPEGYVRTFVDEGPQLAQLLRRAVVQGTAVDYAGSLLAALEEEAMGVAAPLVEPLSPRETEVLRLLTTHLSHAEMAEELVVSVNTVRSHVKNIYGKLDVHSRMEAVERATELGLLD